MPFLLLLLAPALLAAAPERTRVYTMDASPYAIPDPITLRFQQSVTIRLPDRIVNVITGSADVIQAEATGSVGALRLVESPWVKTNRPETNVTFFLADDSMVTLRVQVAAKAAQADLDALEVVHTTGFQSAVEARAVRLLDQWLSESDEQLDRRLQTQLQSLSRVIERRGERQVLDAVSAHGLAWLDVAGRTKSEFIYLALEGAVRMGERIVLRGALINHSQPTFVVESVRLRVNGEWLAPESVRSAVPDPVVPADGQPRAWALVFPASRLRWPIGVQVCGQGEPRRCVDLDVPEP